jgi:hypothetical protein
MCRFIRVRTVRVLLFCVALAVPALAIAPGAHAQTSCGDFQKYGDISMAPDEGFVYTVGTGDVQISEIKLDYHDGTFANVANLPPSSTVTFGDPSTPPSTNPASVEPKTWPQGTVDPVDLTVTGSLGDVPCTVTITVATVHVGVECTVCVPCPVCTPAANPPGKQQTPPGPSPPGARPPSARPPTNFTPQAAGQKCEQALRRLNPAWGVGTKKAKKCRWNGTAYSCRARVYCAKCACHCWYYADVKVGANGKATVSRIRKSKTQPSLTSGPRGRRPRAMVAFPTRVPLLGPALDDRSARGSPD